MMKCKHCGVPFTGLRGKIASLIGVRKSGKHPDYCNKCEHHAKAPRKVAKRKKR